MVPGSRGSGWLSERAATTISAPSVANARAMSLPIPRELPVTIATFPASVISHLSGKKHEDCHHRWTQPYTDVGCVSKFIYGGNPVRWQQLPKPRSKNPD